MTTPTRPGRRRRCAATFSALSLTVAGLAGCSTSAASGPSASASVSAFSVDGVSVSGAIGTKPSFLISDSTQTTKAFTADDVVVGTGPAVTSNDSVTVQYAARSAKTKRQFDSSWDRGTMYTFVPGKTAFPAFSEGVVGMKAGGRRLVVVPGALAFGVNPPASTGLGANETLVFVIDLVSVGASSSG